MSISLLPFVFCLQTFGTGGPPSVSEMVARRLKEVKTAEISWSINKMEGGLNAHYRDTVSPNGVIHRKVVGPDGVVQPNLLGKTSSACAEEYWLVKGDHLWTRKHHRPNVWRIKTQDDPKRVKQLSAPFQDPRLFGILPVPAFNVWPSKLSSVCKVEDGRIVFRDAHRMMWLEHTMGEHGWPVRIKITRFTEEDGKRTPRGFSVQRIKYRKHGKIYFPVEIARVSAAGTIGPVWEIVATINQPKQAKELWPEDIGVLIGMPIQNRSPTFSFLYYIGADQCLDGEGFRAYARDQRAADPTRTWNQEYRNFFDYWYHNRERTMWPEWVHDKKLGVGMGNVLLPSAWEMYVRRFCILHKVTEGQKNAAYAVFRDCNRSAEPLRQKFSEGEDVEQQLIDIFNKRMVPRLEALLSGPQREAGKPPTK